MTPRDLKDMQYILKHYLDLTEKKYKRDPIRRLAVRLQYKIETRLLKE